MSDPLAGYGIRRALAPRALRAAAPLAAVLAVWLGGWAALPQFGPGWDEALGDLFFGERYLSFFTTLDPVDLDFERDPYPPGRLPDLSGSPFRTRPWEHFPVGATLAAASSELLSRRLGWLDPFAGFHAVNLFLATLLVLVFHRFLDARWGGLAAATAVGLLFTSPRVVYDLLVNVKDFPSMVLFTLAALAALRALESGSARGVLGAGALGGLALGARANALFLPLLPLGTVLLAGVPERWRGRRFRLAASSLFAAALALAVLVAVWPYLWADPLGRSEQALRFLAGRRATVSAASLAPALAAVLLTTPPVFLALAGVGLVEALRRARRRELLAAFFLVWIAVVLGRYALPWAVNYDGVRHLLELFPALAAVAGLGAATVARLAARWIRALGHPYAKAALGALLVAPSAWAVAASHPFPSAYWNSFTGGPRGAYASGRPQFGDYWGTSYRLGLRWLDEHAPPGALLAVPVVEHAVRLAAPTELRSDITLLPLTSPLSPQIPPDRLARMREAARTRPLYVMFVERRDWMNELMLDCLRRLEPEAVWSLDGAPILRIYRWTPPPGG